MDSSKQWRIGLIVTVLLGLLAIVASLFTPYLTDKDKKLEFSYNISPLLVSQQISSDSRLKITMDNVPVNYPRLVEITVKNTGRLPIDDADFKSPISVSFEEAKIIGTATVTSQPEGVLSTITLMAPLENGLAIKPGLMNVDDQISVSILVDAEQPAQLKPKARIVGIKDIALKELNYVNATSIEKRVVVILMACLGLLASAYSSGFILSLMVRAQPSRTHSSFVFFILMFYGPIASVSIQAAFTNSKAKDMWTFSPIIRAVATFAFLLMAIFFGYRKARLLQLRSDIF